MICPVCGSPDSSCGPGAFDPGKVLNMEVPDVMGVKAVEGDDRKMRFPAQSVKPGRGKAGYFTKDVPIETYDPKTGKTVKTFKPGDVK